jgi:hypothetical protein
MNKEHDINEHDINEHDNMHNNLTNLIEKYKTNEYVFGRLINYMENLLPVALENAAETHKQREERRIQLSENRDEFTARFLQKNKYFYSSQTELFLHYDGLHFVVHSEDDIQHQILSTITNEKCLREWKHKINKNIIKRIKDRSPLKAIPESATIQFVINLLCPSIFPTRNHAKYFLTIIGESMSTFTSTPLTEPTEINTTTNTIYILNPVLKEIIREIGNQCYTYLGYPNIVSNIKFKYHEHNYADCRLLVIDKIYSAYGRKKISTPALLHKHMLDFLCVAAHYATRYGTADQFLVNCNETRLVDHSLFLTKNTSEDIVDNFIDKTLTHCVSSSIDIKKMIFLWKKYLDDLSIPNIIFYETLKPILKSKLNYDNKTDCFLGITSIHLPVVSQFIKFWETTITVIDSYSDNQNKEENTPYSVPDTVPEPETETEIELEIEEICSLFKIWTSLNKTVTINDIFILDLIQHFYPDVVIEDSKYMLNVKCILWDKRADVLNAFTLFKLQNTSNDFLYDDVYSFYCLHNKNKNNLDASPSKLLVSKRYFDNIISEITSNGK